MSTIFPLSASVNQIFDGYRFNGEKWEIIGVDLTADYPEIVEGKISASVIPDTFATVAYVDQEVGNIDLSELLNPSIIVSSSAISTASIGKDDNWFINSSQISGVSAGDYITILNAPTQDLWGMQLVDINGQHQISQVVVSEGTTFYYAPSLDILLAEFPFYFASSYGNFNVSSNVNKTISPSEISYLDGINSQIATIEYVDNEIANIDALPSQSGNEGKFLTTSGSSSYWETVDALPLQSGNSGKFLTTDGSSASWASVDLSGASAAAVAAIVDSAPETLNTLNELAAALNDDSNFATTVTNSLSEKLDIVSASVTYAPLNSPTLTTPNIGVASGTSLSLTNNVVAHIDRVNPSFTQNEYTLNGSEDGCLVLLNNGADATVYVPTDATYNFPKGTQITLVQSGIGQITVAAADSNTTTINYTPGNKLRAQWSAATLIKYTNNTWLLMGDLEL